MVVGKAGKRADMEVRTIINLCVKKKSQVFRIRPAKHLFSGKKVCEIFRRKLLMKKPSSPHRSAREMYPLVEVYHSSGFSRKAFCGDGNRAATGFCAGGIHG